MYFDLFNMLVLELIIKSFMYSIKLLFKTKCWCSLKKILVAYIISNYKCVRGIYCLLDNYIIYTHSLSNVLYY